MHGICSHRLVHKVVVELSQTIRELDMFDNYYIGHRTFNIIF